MSDEYSSADPFDPAARRAFPRWGYNKEWGYGLSGGLGLVLVVVLVLAILGYIPHHLNFS